MKQLQVMCRGIGDIELGRDEAREGAVGLGEDELDRIVVDLEHLRWPVPDQHVPGWVALDFLAVLLPVPPVHDIVGGEGMPVRPAHAAA